jgi:hypothetical protein
VPEEKENIFEFPNLKGMHVIHVNAISILPKMSELRIMAKESKGTDYPDLVDSKGRFLIKCSK